MKKTRHASPIILAILCAVGVHTVLFTDAGHRIQGDITESGTQISVSDASLVVHDDNVSLILQKDIMQVNKITASLVYNNESIVVSEPESTLGNLKEESEEYSDTIHILFSSPKNITKGTVLATWKISKILPQIYTINLVDMQVESSEGIVNLSTRGTGEF